MEFWQLWWVWLTAGVVLAILEVAVPGFIFLGFALGAVIMAGVVTLFPAIGTPALLAIFAILSLLAWIGLRMGFRKQSSGARVVTRDINEN